MNPGSDLISRWTVTCAPALMLGLAFLATLSRRAQRRHHVVTVKELDTAKEQGTNTASLLHPEIDLSKCIGCGACVRACPEHGVLSIIHGQAAVIHGSRCVGHGECASACPVGAIALTLGDLSQRKDLPALQEDYEAVGVPGLYLAGELSGYALVRNAVAQGVAVADAVEQRIGQSPPVSSEYFDGKSSSSDTSEKAADILDLLVVGAGPGGLACSLRAKEHNLNFLTIESESRVGGTIAAYPRKKLVMTQPLELPLYGRLHSLTYAKEELIDIWEKVIGSNALPIRTGTKLMDLTRSEDGIFRAKLENGIVLARNVCLALGRRGSPRKLGVPGEDLAKVSYGLIDAASYQGRNILIVGGGDSAVEAAVALSQQRGNCVTISYRKSQFVRLKHRNATHISRLISTQAVAVVFDSEITAIQPHHVQLRLQSGDSQTLKNDEVFIFAGGNPPFELLSRAGVSFDPADRPPTRGKTTPTAKKSAILLISLFTSLIVFWAFWFRSYYAMEHDVRVTTSSYALLRPAGPVGLAAGVVGTGLFLANLAYLIRRSKLLGRFLPGTRRAWMRYHIITGLLGLMLVLIHSGFTLRPTVGGHALAALLLVVLTGSIGRYLYALLPRATNGLETGLEELRARLLSLSNDWEHESGEFVVQVRSEIDALASNNQWHASFFSRLALLLLGQFRLRRRLSGLQRSGRAAGICESEINHVLKLASKGYRLKVLVTHYDEVAAVVATWRYFHRWISVLMVLLTIIHIATAARYAGLAEAFGHLVDALMRR